MSEQGNATPVAQAPEQVPARSKGQKKRRARKLRSAIVAAVIVAAVGVGGVFLWRFLSKSETVDSKMQTAVAELGSIQSSVQGSGSARSKESAAITLQAMGTVEKLYVTEGQTVTEGEPLYEIFSPDAQEKLKLAQKELDDAQESLRDAQQALADAQENYQDTLEDQRRSEEERFVKAPFTGQLRETVRHKVGDKVSRGEKLAVLVNDRKFRIPFYFSYAYQEQIVPGQRATVSVGSSTLVGTVEEINLVRRVTPEGALLFEAVVVLDNPGALTDGLSASAVLTAADGTPIYPYDTGTLEYYETQELWSEPARASRTEGTQVEQTMLRDYLDVREGQVLFTLSAEDFDADLKDAAERVSAARETVEKQQNSLQKAYQAVETAQKELENFSATAPISGTVTSCMLAEGQEVKSGDTVITISNNATMIVNISVDDRNIAYVKPGMGVELQSNYDGSTFYGVVTKIDMSLSGDSMGSGMTNYPVTLEVDNLDGSLLEGMWLSYSFVTSQSDNCIVVPMQSVKYVSTDDGETAAVVFIQADARPDNAVTLPEEARQSGMGYGATPTYPTEEEGYYAVSVSTGLSDNYNVEITEGLSGGETVFVNYYVEQAWG